MSNCPGFTAAIRFGRALMAIAMFAVSVEAIGGEIMVWRGDYVPPPEPVKSKVTLGVYIFPGWYRDKGRGDYPYRTIDEESEWKRCVAKQPKPRALLGFYDDSVPEVNDWHIKWALEHGISYFAFDWYWNAGEKRLMRSLERGFLKAKYSHLMKFCIHWCNHTLDWGGPGPCHPVGVSDFNVSGGVMKARVGSNDPAFLFGLASGAELDASKCRYAAIRMKLDKGTMAQLFWATEASPEMSEDKSIRFNTTPDNEFHEYLLDLAAANTWRGKVTKLRLDPNSGCPGSMAEVDYMRVLDTPGGKPQFARDFSADWSGRKPLDSSREALIEMTEYLADNYFRLPNHLTVDGRPVLMIYQPQRVITANGGPPGFRRTLEGMNKLLRSKGFRNMYLIAIEAHMPITGDIYGEAGFDAMTSYCYYATDPDSRYERKGGYSVPYEEIIKHYETVWKDVTRIKKLPYMVPIGTNWDCRPRHGEDGFAVTGKSPEKFEVMCANSLKYIDRNVDMAIIEAWNEWGEGSILEPDREWRFGFLDVVRKVFTDGPANHIDYVPNQDKVLSWSILNREELARAAEMEKQPYPEPPPSLRTVRVKVDEPLPDPKILKAWEFGSGPEGWRPYQVEPLEVRDGVLRTTVTGSDPQLTRDNVDVSIADIGCIALRLRASKWVSDCQVFWSKQSEPRLSPGKSFRFPLETDGEWHTYQVFKGKDEKWNGTLKGLRFDIGSIGDRMEVDWIRICGKE